MLKASLFELKVLSELISVKLLATLALSQLNKRVKAASAQSQIQQLN